MIDDSLLQQARQVSGLATTQEIIDKALQLLIGRPAPAAKKVSTSSKTGRIGALKGCIQIAADFDAPLPEVMLSAFRGEQPRDETFDQTYEVFKTS